MLKNRGFSSLCGAMVLMACILFSVPGYSQTNPFPRDIGLTKQDLVMLHDAAKKLYSGELRGVLHEDVYQHSAFARPEAPLETVRQGWKEAFGKHQLPLLHAQLREAQEAVARDMTPENERRFRDLKKRLYELELKARE